MNKAKRSRTAAVGAVFAALCLLGLIPTGLAARHSKEQHKQGSTVYVCACLRNRSCSCMTEAKTEGPCSCGSSGGPPMKAVPSDSAWAKTNRAALAQK